MLAYNDTLANGGWKYDARCEISSRGQTAVLDIKQAMW